MATAGSIGAVVLCGGESSRMGRNKADLPFGGQTLLERVVEALRPVTARVVLAAGRDQLLTPALRGLTVSRDAQSGLGPLPAVLGAVPLLETARVFVVSCDTPLLQGGLVHLLAQLTAGHDAAVPLVGGHRMPTCAAYDTAATLDAGTRFGDPSGRSLKAFLEILRIRDVPEPLLRTADPDLLSFIPCNTPEEYERALELAGIRVNGRPSPAV